MIYATSRAPHDCLRRAAGQPDFSNSFEAERVWSGAGAGKDRGSRSARMGSSSDWHLSGAALGHCSMTGPKRASRCCQPRWAGVHTVRSESTRASVRAAGLGPASMPFLVGRIAVGCDSAAGFHASPRWHIAWFAAELPAYRRTLRSGTRRSRPRPERRRAVGKSAVAARSALAGWLVGRAAFVAVWSARCHAVLVTQLVGVAGLVTTGVFVTRGA